MRQGVFAALIALIGGVASAAPLDAVPYYTPQQFAQGMQQWQGAMASEFARLGAPLAAALQARCDGAPIEEARRAWIASVTAWERYATVVLGPVLERRSARRIDFSPPRPALIERAIAAQAFDAAALERTGSPAKGFPALEWLLWQVETPPATPTCRYAMALGSDIAREAQTLADAATANAPVDETQGSGVLSDTLNQWIAGLETLRSRHMERPLQASVHSRRDPAVFPRIASGGTARSWAAQWQALRHLAVQEDEGPAQPGAGLVPFETYLRGLGLTPRADALRTAVWRCDAALDALDPTQHDRVQAATAALATLRRLVEDEVAPALNVSVGFSDADGD